MRLPLPALAAVLCTAGASACLRSPPPVRLPTVSSYSQDGWLLTIRTDPFTRERDCALVNRLGYSPDATASPYALSFRFARRIDTSQAWYRIGDAAPQPWRDLIPQLIDEGAMGQTEGLSNPSGGVVRIPAATLSGAAAITIRPAKDTAPRRFDLRGAWPLLTYAKSLQCRLADTPKVS